MVGQSFLQKSDWYLAPVLAGMKFHKAKLFSDHPEGHVSSPTDEMCRLLTLAGRDNPRQQRMKRSLYTRHVIAQFAIVPNYEKGVTIDNWSTPTRRLLFDFDICPPVVEMASKQKE